MEDFNIDEFNKKAEDLIQEWHVAKTRELDLEVRGLELNVDTVLVSFKYIPYFLATLYYSWMNYRIWSKHKTDKEWEKLNLWTDKSTERILSLAPNHKIDIKNCRNDIKDLMKKMHEEVDLKNPNSASNILSDEIFKIFQKYYPKAQSRDRELIDYIIRTELASLKGKF